MSKLSITIVAASLWSAQAFGESRVAWHNGDPCDCGLTLMVSHYQSPDHFALVFDDFTVPREGWTVTGLYADHLMKGAPREAYWELRSGVERGSGGLLLGSGRSLVSALATQKENLDGDSRFRLEVAGLQLRLVPGRYWLALAPVGPEDAYLIPTQGDGAVGGKIEASKGAVINMRSPQNDKWDWFPAVLLRSVSGERDAKGTEYSKGVRILR